MLTLLLTLAFVYFSEASLFNLELQFHNYSNPNTSNINGNCCDQFGNTCFSPCEPFFTVCLKNLNSSNNCPWSNQIKVSGISSGDILLFSNNTIGGNLSNPIEFYNINSTNESAIQIYIYIRDTDFGTLSDGIDEIFVQVPLSSNNTSPVQQYTGIHGSAIMGLSYQVTCSDNYYGADCSVFCEPQNGTDGVLDDVISNCTDITRNGTSSSTNTNSMFLSPSSPVVPNTSTFPMIIPSNSTFSMTVPTTTTTTTTTSTNDVQTLVIGISIPTAVVLFLTIVSLTLLVLKLCQTKVKRKNKDNSVSVCDLPVDSNVAYSHIVDNVAYYHHQVMKDGDLVYSEIEVKATNEDDDYI